MHTHVTHSKSMWSIPLREHSYIYVCVCFMHLIHTHTHKPEFAFIADYLDMMLIFRLFITHIFLN